MTLMHLLLTGAPTKSVALMVHHLLNSTHKTNNANVFNSASAKNLQNLFFLYFSPVIMSYECIKSRKL